ncbi:MAG: hypothetical protein LH478_04195 [Chitinophagaceae bacterium]|nr:hypothetical protein [Chitinophagaceae bacterium]
MAIFQDLEVDNFYLLKMSENDSIKLVQVAMATEKCVLVYEFGEADSSFWKKKDDTIFEIVEELTEEAIDEYEALILEDYDEEELSEMEDIEEENDDEEDNDKKKKKKKKK